MLLSGLFRVHSTSTVTLGRRITSRASPENLIVPHAVKQYACFWHAWPHSGPIVVVPSIQVFGTRSPA